MADRASIRATLYRFLQEDTSIQTANLTDTTDLADGMGLDSVDFVGLIMRIEGHYRIRFTRPELDDVRTLGELLTMIETKWRKPAIAA